MVPLTSQLKGILFLIISGAILSFTDGLAKYLTGHLVIGEIIFFRACFVFVPVAMMIWWHGGLSSLRVNSWRVQGARAACVVITTFMFLGATRYLPLADAIAILFASPIFITAMAPFALGEQVGWRRWTAVLVGFGGVLLMIRPGSNPLVWSAVLALGATFVLSIRDVITRRMSGTESTSAIMAVSTGGILLCGLITLPLSWIVPGIGAWRMPTLEEFGLLALTGSLQGVGQYFMVTAFLLAEAVVVVPFRYFSLIFAVLFGYLLFGDVPEAIMFAGAAVVVGSGLYIFQREVRIAKQVQPKV
jgi:drug/metabolite transporter (DMT)-like permease